MARIGKSYKYEIFDVFTEQKLAGNPLAIVYGSDDLQHEDMLKIAAEFNLSETVFVRKSQNPIHSANIAIYTPDYKMPFAGHPTVGTAIAQAMQKPVEDASILILEEKIGPVRCAVDLSQDVPFAAFDLPKLPEHYSGFKIEKEVLAAALGIETHEIGFENHSPQVWSAGVPYLFVPVHNMLISAKINFDTVFYRQNIADIDGHIPNCFIYCRDTHLFESAFHARMMTTDNYEDPATGSAVSAFAGQVVMFDSPHEGQTDLWIEQGFEMGRPSRILLELHVAQHKLAQARIGGHAVKVAEGTLLL